MVSLDETAFEAGEHLAAAAVETLTPDRVFALGWAEAVNSALSRLRTEMATKKSGSVL